jgi:hypothetical protein
LKSRPILRKATSLEVLREGGTRVRIWLKVPPDSEKGLLVWNNWEKKKYSLKELCEWLCPSIDCNLFTKEGKDVQELVVESGDWINIDEKTLIRRIIPISDKSEIDKESEDIIAVKNNMRIVCNEKGEPILRACIRTSYNLPQGIVTVGGLRASELYGIVGISVGTTTKIARDISIPIIDEVSIAKWASEQAKLINKIRIGSEMQESCANRIRICGGDVNDLAIAYSNYGWMNYKQIVERYTNYEEIILLEDREYYSQKEIFEKIELDIELEDNVIVVSKRPSTSGRR